MAREDWQDREEARRRAAMRGRDDRGLADDARRRAGYGIEDEMGLWGEDYGQADYPGDDARWIGGGDGRRGDQPRSWTERIARRRGPSDRVLWAVISERLEDAHGLDLRDVEVVVEEAEVTLNGTVRHKADKRRVEDIADIDGIRHVQNNLRVRERDHWTFF